MDEEFLKAGRFVDSDAAAVIAFARDHAGAGTRTEQVLRVYRAVRDDILYDPYGDFFNPDTYRASAVLRAGRGFCVGKAALFAACARALGAPARVGYADVRNHMTSAKLQDSMGSDLFVWHSYAEIKLDGVWAKATPAFNASLCARLNLAPLEFDGKVDSLFHAFDNTGRRHMEYVRDRGTFADVPFETIIAAFREHYPRMEGAQVPKGDFQKEAVAG